MKKIIDISHHNNVDKIIGVDGVMIRATFGKVGIDSCLEKHVRLAEESKIPYGFYFYSYALNVETALKEVTHFLSIIAKYKPTLPLAIDMEDADSYKKRNGFPNNKTLVNICKISCEEIEKHGYYALIYASDSWFTTYLRDSELDRYGKWVARWGEKNPVTTYQMWQYTSTGSVNGINGNVDISRTILDFTVLFKKMKAKTENVKTENDVSRETFSENVLKVGDKVKVTSRYDYNGVKCAKWVLTTVFDVIQVSNDRVVIGIDGKVTSAWTPDKIVKID